MLRLGSVFCAGVRRLTLRCVLASVLAAATGVPAYAQTHAQSGAYATHAVRAAFLLNFLRFTEWPRDAIPENSPYVIGVSGSRAVEEELLALAERQLVHGRRIRVVRIKNVRDAIGCHIVYISSESTQGEELGPDAGELLQHIRGRPVLSVSSADGFLAQGGIVNFYVGEKGTLSFEIAPSNAKAGGLVLNSRLLALAKIVEPKK